MPDFDLPGNTARVVARSTDECLLVWYRTVIALYRGHVTSEGVLDTMQLCQTMLVESPQPLTFLSVIERSSPAPTEPVRRALARWSSEVVTRLAAAVIVAEGGGFKNAIVRGVGVALTVLAPHRVPFKFAGSVAEGVSLLAHFLPPTSGGASALALAIADARERWRREP